MLFASLAAPFWVLIVVCNCAMWVIPQFGTFLGNAQSAMSVTTDKLLWFRVAIQTLYGMYMLLLWFTCLSIASGAVLLPGILHHTQSVSDTPFRNSTQLNVFWLFPYLWTRCKPRAQWSRLKCTGWAGIIAKIQIFDILNQAIRTQTTGLISQNRKLFWYAPICWSSRVPGAQFGDAMDALC